VGAARKRGLAAMRRGPRPARRPAAVALRRTRRRARDRARSARGRPPGSRLGRCYERPALWQSVYTPAHHALSAEEMSSALTKSILLLGATALVVAAGGRALAQSSPKATAPAIAWLGLNGTATEDRRGSGDAAATAIAAIRSELGGDARLLPLPVAPTGGDLTRFLARSIDEAVDQEASGIVIPAGLLWHADPRSVGFHHAVEEAWSAGALLITADEGTFGGTPIGVLQLTLGVEKSASSGCALPQDVPPDRAVIPFCLPGNAAAQGSPLSRSDRALAAAAAALARCNPSPSRKTLDRAACVLLAGATRAASPGSTAEPSPAERPTDANAIITFAGHTYHWDQRVAALPQPIDLEPSVGTTRDPRRQLLLLLNSGALLRDLMMLTSIAGLYPLYVQPLKQPVAIFRFRANTTGAERELALSILRSQQGNSPGKVFRAVGVDMPVNVQ
jgi:hypothetical protein